MSKLKLRLAGLAFIVLSLVALGGSLAPAAAGSNCIDVVVWGTNPKTGECRQFANPCSVPPGWTISYTGCAS
ncbi:MAG: hypothetical protein QOF89_1307 [Acidobacteriota bacterium]|jgi:hypothetical protein|nr:hypothetical protein [Acidobacteriota bacterium]